MMVGVKLREVVTWEGDKIQEGSHDPLDQDNIPIADHNIPHN